MENLGIDIKLLVAQVINFALFFIIIKKFVAKPFMAFLSGEKNKEKEKQKLLADVAKQQEEFTKKEKELQIKLKKELETALIEVKSEASIIKKEMIEAAKVEAEAIKNNAKKEIQNEKESLYKQVKNKVSELSLFIVNQALSDVLDDDIKKKVSRQILKSLPRKSDIYEN